MASEVSPRWMFAQDARAVEKQECRNKAVSLLRTRDSQVAGLVWPLLDHGSGMAVP